MWCSTPGASRRAVLGMPEISSDHCMSVTLFSLLWTSRRLRYRNRRRCLEPGPGSEPHSLNQTAGFLAFIVYSNGTPLFDLGDGKSSSFCSGWHSAFSRVTLTLLGTCSNVAPDPASTAAPRHPPKQIFPAKPAPPPAVDICDSTRESRGCSLPFQL
jgi:hypothetical protein